MNESKKYIYVSLIAFITGTVPPYRFILVESVSELNDACAKEDTVLNQSHNDDDLKDLKEGIKVFRKNTRYRQYWYQIGKKVIDQSNCTTFLVPRFSDFEEYTSCLPVSMPFYIVLKPSSKKTPKVVATKYNINWKTIFIILGSIVVAVILLILVFCCAPNIKVSLNVSI